MKYGVIVILSFFIAFLSCKAQAAYFNDDGQLSGYTQFTTICDSINIAIHRFLLETASREISNHYSNLLDQCDNVNNRGSKSSLSYLLRSRNLDVYILTCQMLEKRKVELRSDVAQNILQIRLNMFKQYCLETILPLRPDHEQYVNALILGEEVKYRPNRSASGSNLATYLGPLLISLSIAAIVMSLILILQLFSIRETSVDSNQNT